MGGHSIFCLTTSEQGRYCLFVLDIIVLYDNIVWLLYEFICVCDKLQALPASHLNNGKMLQPQWDQRFVGYSYHKFLKKN